MEIAIAGEGEVVIRYIDKDGRHVGHAVHRPQGMGRQVPGLHRGRARDDQALLHQRAAILVDVADDHFASPAIAISMRALLSGQHFVDVGVRPNAAEGREDAGRIHGESEERRRAKGPG